MSKYRALVVGTKDYNEPFDRIGMEVINGESLSEFYRAHLVVFTGGEDVHPRLYGEKPASGSVQGAYNLDRDKQERTLFLEAVKRQVPMVGICRGAQFLSVMNGGRVVQHVDNHLGTHLVETYQNREFEVNSTHHQMMDLTNVGRYDLLAWANGLSPRYVSGKGTIKPKEKQKEPEMVWFPTTISLACQWHPERMQKGDPAYIFFEKALYQFLVG